MEPRTYLTLTIAGLAMGMLIFLVASGLTLIFGLMDVLELRPRRALRRGAYAGLSALVLLDRRWGWASAPSVGANAALLLAAIAAAVAGGVLARHRARARHRAARCTASTCSRS